MISDTIEVSESNSHNSKRSQNKHEKVEIVSKDFTLTKDLSIDVMENISSRTWFCE